MLRLRGIVLPRMDGLKVGMWDMLMKMGRETSVVPVVFLKFGSLITSLAGGGELFSVVFWLLLTCRMFYITDRVKELIKYKGNSLSLLSPLSSLQHSSHFPLSTPK